MPRVFFALWPDAAVRGELERAAQELQRDGGGRVMPRGNLHQTLVFVGGITGEQLAGLKALAGEIHAPPFALEFGVTGYWRHNRIVWAAPVATPAPLAHLVSALEQGLNNARIAFDRRPYVPHITLLRNARAPKSLPALRFAWPVRDFVLVGAARGARAVEYRVIARWPLVG